VAPVDEYCQKDQVFQARGTASPTAIAYNGRGLLAVADGFDAATTRRHYQTNALSPAAVLAGIANFAFGLIPLAGLLIFFYPDRISPMVVFIPVIAAVQLVFTLAVCLFVAGVNVFFRDVGNVARHFLRLWFYMSPALYSASQMAEIGKNEPAVAAVLAANPFSPLFESYRNVIYSGTLPLFKELLAVLGVSGVLLLLALLFFKRVEPAFAKVL